jgi:hypothetical protein
MGMTTTEFRARKSIEKNTEKRADIAMAQRLHDKGMSNGAIGVRMAKNGVPRNESSIRALLEPGAKDKADQLTTIADQLKRAVDEKGPVQIGLGVENQMGISNDKLKIAVEIMKQKGYAVGQVQAPQLGTAVGNKTTIKYLAPHGTKYSDMKDHADSIRNITEHSHDFGRSFTGLVPPIQISSKRIGVKYAEDGGGNADGVIFVRPGVKDLSMGAAHYAQVRIGVDGTHYLKGMAMYKDDLPSGLDLVFNTGKSKKDIGTDKHDAMKPNDTKDPANPFTSMVRQLPKLDAHGTEIPGTVRSAMNLVNEEGDWGKWKNSMSSQMLSKQHPALAREQLAKQLEDKQKHLDETMALTNPTVRRKLLETYAAGADSSALHLEAKAFPKQGTHIILPISSLKEHEIYAPNFDNGTPVVLIRFPHGGPFEIPELVVNNKHPESRKFLEGAKDAVGINPEVAKRLSGADFDGDTVLVIPNHDRKIKSAPPLAGLENFDPIHEYPEYEGMTLMTKHNKGVEMGKISNLITDMTIKSASQEEICRAVKHSMVVIDSEKHKLDYKRSALNNGITGLKRLYQGGPTGGASTLISLAKARKMVPTRRARRQGEGGPVDTTTGQLMYMPKNETYQPVKTGVDPITGKKIYTPKGPRVTREQRSQQMTETTNAHTLSTGTVMEEIYAEHANKMKALANAARREAVNTKPLVYQPSARIAYAREVASLNAKLSIAISNKPAERQAQALAKANIDALMQANSNMDKAETTKLQYRALKEARDRVGAKKQPVEITPNEWDAIQAGAITDNRLSDILNNTKLEDVRKLAMPKPKPIMTAAKQDRAQSMLDRGFTRAEVAKALGVSVTTLRLSLSPSTEGG